jgi:hypothetical protein
MHLAHEKTGGNLRGPGRLARLGKILRGGSLGGRHEVGYTLDSISINNGMIG